MSEPIAVAPRVLVPAAAISWRAVRSSGPGGQNVNKVASKVELRVDLGAITGLSAGARARLAAAAATRLDADGRLLVTSQRTRDQGRNLEDARDKVRQLVADAMVEPRRRRATRPSAGSKDRRVRKKKAAADVKRGRARVRPDDD
ncbi:MAG: alternative ribosome rescue aminoacyl-tRNA hydrolase ArfB [Vicinamibacteria bacterium]